jgi:HME family heavy-metal exporter
MFNFLVTTSLRYRVVVLSIAALLVAYGMYVLPRVPIDVFPDLTRPSVTIMTEAEGLPPPEVERLITGPVESALRGVGELARVRSTSAPGLSIVLAEFEWTSDLNAARAAVAERIGRLQGRLPAGMTPQMSGIGTIMGETHLVAVTAPGLDGRALRDIVDRLVRPRLLDVPGIVQVNPIGGGLRQVRIAPDLAAMADRGVTLDALALALSRVGASGGGGFVQRDGVEFVIRASGTAVDLAAIRLLPIAVAGGSIRLENVANVAESERTRRGDAGYNGSPAVILSVQKAPTADTLPVSRAVEATLREIQAGMPAGVRADQIQFRQADFIETAVGNLGLVLIEAAIAVTLVLAFFLLNGRATAISLTAIPISILVTVLVFQAFGLSLNTMTLGGLAIAIGELVDDAVVDVENILRRLHKNAELASPLPSMTVIAQASQEVRSGILYATFIIVLVLLPLFFLPGLEGRLFVPLGVAYVVSILASLLVSITVTPALASYFLTKPAKRAHGDTPVLRVLKRWNERALLGALQRPKPVMAGAGALVVAAIVAGVFLPRAFLPPFNEGTALVGMRFEPGIGLDQSQRLGLLAETLVMRVPEVVSVGRRTGRAEFDSHAEGVHAAEIDVTLRASARSREVVFADIRERLSVLPASVVMGQPISHRIDHMLSGVRAALSLKVFGEDQDAARIVAEGLRVQMQRIPGLVDVNIEKLTLVPQIEIRPDPAAAALYGMTPQAVTDLVSGLAGGRTVAQIGEGARRTDVVVRLDDAERTPEGLRSLLVPTPKGHVPLWRLADVVETAVTNQVMRENGERRIIVYANGDGSRDMAAIAADLQRLVQATPMPNGLRIVLDGTFRAQEAATRSMAILGSISMLLVLALLWRRYRSMALALMVLAVVPMGIVGAVAALWISGQPLSVASMIGFVTLAGIAARNGILKVSHWINLAMNEGERFGPALVLRGAQERLAPVLMTALSAGLALTPLLFGADQPGREILHPVAVTIFGGLITATLLDAVLTPVLFYMFGRRPLERLVAQREADAARTGAVEPQAAF